MSTSSIISQSLETSVLKNSLIRKETPIFHTLQEYEALGSAMVALLSSNVAIPQFLSNTNFGQQDFRMLSTPSTKAETVPASYAQFSERVKL